MPTSLDRIQCLMQPSTYAAVLTLVNVTGKTKSNMACELIEHALKDPKYRDLLEGADEAQTVAAKEDPRSETRKASFHRQPSKAIREEAERSSYTEFFRQLKAAKEAGLALPGYGEPQTYERAPGPAKGEEYWMPERGMPNGMVSDGRGGMVDPTLSDEEVAQMQARAKQQKSTDERLDRMENMIKLLASKLT